MKDFSKLKKNLKKDFSKFNSVNVALLGDTSTQFLRIALKGIGYENHINLNIWEADYNQIESQVYHSNSDFYNFNPEFVVLFFSSQKLLDKYNKETNQGQSDFTSHQLARIQSIIRAIERIQNVKVILYNFPEIDDAVFGSFANKVSFSFLFQVRKLNYELMNYATEKSNLFICDLSSVQNKIGRSNFFHSSIYINSEMIISLDALPIVASRTVDIVMSLKGRVNKCLILDLDNTMWGGIIGDDGIENIQIGNLGIGKAFTEFQLWVKKLKNRGVILAVCSKNSEHVAKEPFEKHPEMVLKLEDISVFVANWENKADNIRRIQKVLNIGFDSMVFIDDNPFERNIVRENLPQVIVPEMPEDPAEYLEYLYSLNLFETNAISKEDRDRTKLYQTEAKRVSIQESFTNEDDFLKSLKMYAKVESFNEFNTPRVTQLSQRSNQFNLRTVRYSASDVENLSNNSDFHNFAFSLKDKFGDNGLICIVVLKKVNENSLFIENWLMSCRVLNRSMENFVLNTIVEYAKQFEFQQIIGEYIKSAKNNMVKDHYSKLGFIKDDKYWKLEMFSYKPKTTYIKKNEEYE